MRESFANIAMGLRADRHDHYCLDVIPMCDGIEE